MQAGEVKNYESHGDRAVVETQISHCSLYSWLAHRDLMDTEIKLGEGLPSHMTREALVLSAEKTMNGSPLQYSCLENPMGGGAWWAAVHGVAKSRTQLRDFTFTFHFHALEKEIATHSSVLGWRIPEMGEPGGLPSMGSHRVGHNWSDLAETAAAVLLVTGIQQQYDVETNSILHECYLWIGVTYPTTVV